MSAALFAGLGPLGAKIKYLTIVEKVRAAALIAFGQVVDTEGIRLRVRTEQVLKGKSEPVLEFTYRAQASIESRDEELKSGDTVLLFAVLQDAGQISPLAGSQGVLKLGPGWKEIYSNAMTQIMAFDNARIAADRSSILSTMLSEENRVSQYAALEIVYMEYHLDKFELRPLYAPITALARSPDKPISSLGIQLLGRIGDKGTVRTLISMLGDGDRARSVSAHRALNGILGSNIQFDANQPPAVRRQASERLLQWWEENEARTSLVR